jgi:gluconolactonase
MNRLTLGSTALVALAFAVTLLDAATQARAPAAAPQAAPTPPLPIVAPNGTPMGSIDLMTSEGVALVGAQWRAIDAHIVEAPPRPNAGSWTVSYDVQPKAGSGEFDDSSWAVIDAAALAKDRRGGGGAYMTWYRIGVTMPQRIRDFDPAGSIAVFHIVVDDYAEVWVNGQLPRAIAKPSPNLVQGFNLPNRVVISESVKPGERIQIAVFGMNGPISLAPLNPVFVREARIEFFR